MSIPFRPVPFGLPTWVQGKSFVTGLLPWLLDGIVSGAADDARVLDWSSLSQLLCPSTRVPSWDLVSMLPTFLPFSCLWQHQARFD